MIKDLATLRAALSGDKPRFAGLIVYQGPSLLDGAPIVAIVNRITVASSNAKTGALVQSFILRSDMSPMQALANGADASICGDCKHRPAPAMGRAPKRFIGPTMEIKRTCYVNVGRSVRSVFAAFTRGRYARPGVDYDVALLPALFTGARFRIGSYGDGAAVPFQVWRACTVRAAATYGYTHQWRNPAFAAFKLLAMASCDTVAEQIEAVALGWRVFRVAIEGSAKLAGEVRCPASKEMGRKLTCEDCKACGGHSSKARASIVIEAHGATANGFAALVA